MMFVSSGTIDLPLGRPPKKITRPLAAACDAQPFLTPVVQDNLAGASHLRNLRLHQADGTRANDEHRVAWLDARFLVSVVDARQRFSQRGGGKADLVGDREHVALKHRLARDAHELGERAMVVDAQRAVAGV